MFWTKKAEPSQEEKLTAILTSARLTGDKKTETIFTLIQVAEEAQKMNAALEKIIDIYASSLSELSDDACHHFPTALAASIQGLESSFERIQDDVETAAIQTSSLVTNISKLNQAKT